MRLLKTELKSFYNLAEFAAQEFKNKDFLIDEVGKKLSFSDFLKLVDCYATYLNEVHGIQTGDHVGLLLMNSLEFCVSFIAINKLGSTCVLFPTKYTAQGIQSLLHNVSLKLFLYDKSFSESLDLSGFEGLTSEECNFSNEAFLTMIKKTDGITSVEPDLDRDAVLMFTSGTTGKNKRVSLKNYNIIQAILGYEKALDLSQVDSTIIATPIYYVTGLIALFGLFMRVGGTVYLRRRFNHEELVNIIREKDITLIHGSPVVFNLIIGQRSNNPELNSLRYFLCGSGPMSIEKIKEIKEWLPNVDFRTVYGLTETSSPLTIMNEAVATSKYKGSSGRPIATADIRIVDEDGVDLGVDEIGDIEARGATVIQSYYGNEYPELFARGSWLKTGDIGYVCKDGYLFVMDRKKDMINVGGEKVAGSSVEDQIYALGVADEVAVVAVEDELFGEVVGAMIVFKEGKVISEEVIQTLLSTKIAKYQIPKIILKVDEIPKNENMKLDKVIVRKMLNEFKASKK